MSFVTLKNLDHRYTGLWKMLFKGGYASPGYIPARGYLCGCNAAEGRQFPSKPLRESQSRLLSSTPSWTESDNAPNKDLKGKKGLELM